MSARHDTWMPMYWGDYARDTGHLNACGHGAYLMLIKHYWCTGQPLTNNDDELWRIACCDSKAEWLKVKDKIARLFNSENGILRHKRVDRELDKAVSITEHRRAAGKASAVQQALQRKLNTCSTSVATHVEAPLQQNDRPSQSPSQRKEEKTGSLRSPAKTRGCRLPENWVPDQAGYELAIMEGLDPNRELLKFRDYWQATAGTKGVKSDWPATWRNWCRSNYNKPGQSHAATELAVSTGMDLLTPINQQFPRGEHAHERGENTSLAITADDPDRAFGDE